MQSKITDAATQICYISLREELETNLEQISRIISDYGYHVTIINISYVPKDPYLTEDGREIVFVHIPNNLSLPDRIWIRIKKILFTLKAAKAASQRNFGIFHIDTNCRYFFLLKLFYPKIKLIYHIQSYPVSLSKNRISVYKTILGVFLQSLFLDTIIIQDEDQKKRWRGINRQKKTRIVPIGFNNHLLYPLSNLQKEQKREQMGIDKQSLVLIYAGAITKQRELHRLIMAIKKVHDLIDQFYVLFVGNGPHLPAIKKLSLELNINDIIIFTGYIRYEEMVDYYGMSDIGLSYIPINSNYTNNPPLKTYEYLACGLPCIATKTASNCRIIKNNINGVLVEDSPEEISKAIVSLWNDKTRLNQLKKIAPSSVKGFEFETVTAKYVLPLYEEIMSQKAKAS